MIDSVTIANIIVLAPVIICLALVFDSLNQQNQQDSNDRKEDQ